MQNSSVMPVRSTGNPRRTATWKLVSFVEVKAYQEASGRTNAQMAEQLGIGLLAFERWSETHAATPMYQERARKILDAVKAGQVPPKFSPIKRPRKKAAAPAVDSKAKQTVSEGTKQTVSEGTNGKVKENLDTVRVLSAVGKIPAEKLDDADVRRGIAAVIRLLA